MAKKPTIPAPTNRQEHQFGQQHQVVHHQQTTQTVQTIFDPDVLRRYREMVPDAPERVLAVFEKNSATERHLAEGALAAQRADNQRRDWMAFAIIIGGMVTSGAMAYLDKPWLSGGALVAITAYAVIGYLQKPKKPS